jgi:segregation and condensation protein B
LAKKREKEPVELTELVEPAEQAQPEELAEAEVLGPNEQLMATIEALIFASPDPMSLKMLTKLLDSEPKEDVKSALEAVKQRYDRPGGLQLVEVAGGYQIVTRPELHEWVRRLFHERTTQKLSVAALETLAVIAYKQPVTAPEIAEIRGVNTSGVLATLIDRKLVKIVGRKQVVGRPFMYGTTREFLERFGLNDLSDLPKIEDMSELLGFELPGFGDPTPETAALPFEENSENSENTEDRIQNTEEGSGDVETSADETSEEPHKDVIH